MNVRPPPTASGAEKSPPDGTVSPHEGAALPPEEVSSCEAARTPRDTVRTIANSPRVLRFLWQCALFSLPLDLLFFSPASPIIGGLVSLPAWFFHLGLALFLLGTVLTFGGTIARALQSVNRWQSRVKKLNVSPNLRKVLWLIVALVALPVLLGLYERAPNLIPFVLILLAVGAAGEWRAANRSPAMISARETVENLVPPLLAPYTLFVLIGIITLRGSAALLTLGVAHRDLPFGIAIAAVLLLATGLLLWEFGRRNLQYSME